MDMSVTYVTIKYFLTRVRRTKFISWEQKNCSSKVGAYIFLGGNEVDIQFSHHEKPLHLNF